MLARNFLQPADLKITDVEHAALVEVLNRLERGELRHVPMGYGARTPTAPDAFNMSHYHCGTAHCIVGWARVFHPEVFLDEEAFVCSGVMQLACPSPRSNALYDAISTEQAAAALRNYLQTGRPDWAQVLASEGV